MRNDGWTDTHNSRFYRYCECAYKRSVWRSRLQNFTLLNSLGLQDTWLWPKHAIFWYAKGLCVLKCSSCKVFSFPFVVQTSLISRKTRECCPTGFPDGSWSAEADDCIVPQDDKDSQKRETFSTNLHWSSPFSSIRSFPGCFFTSRLLTRVITSFLLSSVFIFFVYLLPSLSVMLFFFSCECFVFCIISDTFPVVSWYSSLKIIVFWNMGKS